MINGDWIERVFGKKYVYRINRLTGLENLAATENIILRIIGMLKEFLIYIIEIIAINPFNSMKSNKDFFTCMSNFHNNKKPVKTLNNESSLLLKASGNLKFLVDKFNNVSPEDNTDPENVVQFKYYDNDMNYKI